MSLPAKMTLVASGLVTISIIGYVHVKQQIDREQLHRGVIRDTERRQMRKTENLYILEKQKELTKIYKAEEAN